MHVHLLQCLQAPALPCHSPLTLPPGPAGPRCIAAAAFRRWLPTESQNSCCAPRQSMHEWTAGCRQGWGAARKTGLNRRCARCRCRCGANPGGMGSGAQGGGGGQRSACSEAGAQGWYARRQDRRRWQAGAPQQVGRRAHHNSHRPQPPSSLTPDPLDRTENWSMPGSGTGPGRLRGGRLLLVVGRCVAGAAGAGAPNAAPPRNRRRRPLSGGAPSTLIASPSSSEAGSGGRPKRRYGRGAGSVEVCLLTAPPPVCVARLSVAPPAPPRAPASAGKRMGSSTAAAAVPAPLHALASPPDVLLRALRPSPEAPLARRLPPSDVASSCCSSCSTCTVDRRCGYTSLATK